MAMGTRNGFFFVSSGRCLTRACDTRRKVVAQESSIVAHMRRAGMLQPWAVYVELGAGSGGLSRYCKPPQMAVAYWR
jgi:hypothetical protein